MRWLYIIGRVKPGVAMAPLQAKITELVRQSFAATGPSQANKASALWPKLA